MPLPAIVPPLIGLAASGIGALAGYKGAQATNRINQEEAEKNRRFQERMRNTVWQAGVEDMRAAGINPALAYSQGGAPAPSGSTPPGAENPVTSAMSGIQMRKSLELLDAQIARGKAEAKSAKAESELVSDRSEYLRRRGELTVGGRTTHGVPLLYDLIDAEVGSARWGAANMKAQAARNQSLASITGIGGGLSERLSQNVFPIIDQVLGKLGPAAQFYFRNSQSESARALLRHLRSQKN